ncbi:hypothetical protein Tco_1245509 [Tanacetum coccineum]
MSRTIDITRADQIALDDALVAPANRLKIGKSNLRLSSDLKSNEPTLQVVYDVLKLTLFYKAFQITADVLEIYMQEFWATTTVHHHLIRFKINNKKHIVNLKDLGHSGEIKVITDVNVNKLHQPWRSFAAEDFVYQVENKNVKRINEMYYPRFTKVCLLGYEDTQLYGAILPDELTNEAIKDSESYKEYCAIALGAEPPKTKAVSRRRKQRWLKPAKKKQPAKTSKAKGLTVLSEVALTEAEQIKLAIKRSLIQTHNSHASGLGADEGTGGKPGVPDVPTYESDDEQISWKSSDEEDDDDDNDNDEDNDDDDNDDVDDDVDIQDDDGQDDNGQEYDGQDDEGQDDDNEKTDSDNDGDKFVHPKFSTHDQKEILDEEDNEEEEVLDKEETNEEDEANELYRDVNVNLEGRDTKMTVSRTIVPNYLSNRKDTLCDLNSGHSYKNIHAVAPILLKLELKKILIDKMESNKSIHRSDEQKNLYKALVDAYESDKLILDIYAYTVSFKRQELMHIAEDLEEPAHQEFNTGFFKDQHVDEATQHHDCNLAQKEDTRDSFNMLMDTPLDFSAFVMNRLKVDIES